MCKRFSRKSGLASRGHGSKERHPLHSAKCKYKGSEEQFGFFYSEFGTVSATQFNDDNIE